MKKSLYFFTILSSMLFAADEDQAEAVQSEQKEEERDTSCLWVGDPYGCLIIEEPTGPDPAAFEEGP